MTTQFATSPDGTRIAFDVCGRGPAIILLHGGGSNRCEWHEAGYVDRLSDDFTVIAMDLRGHGESGLPADPTDYAIDKMEQDILAVADACYEDRFSLWGMSYGGKVGRYLAVHSVRVTKLILLGTPLGLGVSGQLRQDAVDFCAHWTPIRRAQLAGTLEVNSLTQQDQEFVQRFNLPSMLGWVRAMLDWAAVVPGDFRCPVLWLVGSEDEHAVASIKEFAPALKASKVRILLVPGADHEQVFSDIDRVFPAMLAFMNS